MPLAASRFARLGSGRSLIPFAYAELLCSLVIASVNMQRKIRGSLVIL
jgi:hypothetical protein